MAVGRGSLADVLPPTLLDCFAVAAAGMPAEWHAGSGQVHSFSVCTRPADGARLASPSMSVPADTAADDLDAVEAVSSVRRATDVSAPADASAPAADGAGSESERVLGTVVHRLLQTLGTTPPASVQDATAVALRLLRPDEAAGLAERDAFAVRAASTYHALCSHPDVRSLYAAPDILHEVPFALRQEGVVVRGSIDCLVLPSPTEVTVLEFKGGSVRLGLAATVARPSARPRPEHGGQVALYASVASRLFPGARVVPKLIYTDLGPDSSRKAPKA